MSSNEINSTTNAQDKAALFEKLKQAVFARRPVLKDIVEKHGEKSLTRYAQDYFDVNKGNGLEARQDEFIGIFKKEVERLLGPSTAEEAAMQLKKHYFVSTADHQGPICNPYFLSSNLVTAISMMERKDETLKHIIVLSCGSLSVDNDTFPRGLTLNTAVGGEIKPERLPFFSSHERPAAICKIRAYGPAEIDKVKQSARDLHKSSSIGKEAAAKISAVIDDVYNDPEAAACQSYSDQITKTNYKLWQEFFKSSGVTPPNLLYVELEKMVSQLIIERHLFNDTIINKILFAEEYHPLVLKYFDNIMGAFSAKQKWGSYLFWATPTGARYRLQLEKKGRKLVSTDGTYSVDLTPEAIKKALEAKEIIPTLLLDCIILSFYYGLKCLGGFCQVNYLTEMKDAYLALLREVRGHEAEIALAEPVQTKELGESLSIAFAGFGADKLALATGMDLALYQNEKTWEVLKEEAGQITLAEALGPMFPSFYRVAYAGPTRDEALMSLTSHDITCVLNLDKKTKPCVTIG